MAKSRVVSLNKIGVILVSIVLILCCTLGITFSLLTDSKTAIGTITFEGDLAIGIKYAGNNVNLAEESIAINLVTDFTNTIDASTSGNVYFEGKTGQLGSLKWTDSGYDDLIFNVYSNGDTPAYIRFTIELTYTANNGNVPANPQDWQVFPKFGTEAYPMTYTQITEGDDIENCFYGSNDNMVITYPTTTTSGNVVTKTFYCYYLKSDFSGTEAFGPSGTAGDGGYSKLNKSVNFKDIIGGIHFLLDGESAPKDGDQFGLKITCDAAIFLQIY